jgi:hypothetical protein
MAFVSSGRWQPTIGRSGDPRLRHVHGGDVHGAFRKALRYDWGRMAGGPIARKKREKNGTKLVDRWIEP